jgi:hypothetical protein
VGCPAGRVPMTVGTASRRLAVSLRAVMVSCHWWNAGPLPLAGDNGRSGMPAGALIQFCCDKIEPSATARPMRSLPWLVSAAQEFSSFPACAALRNGAAAV